MPGPVFREGETVELRTVEEEDVEFLQDVVNHPAVRPHIFRSDPLNRDQERAWVESLDEVDGFHFLVCDDGTPAGICGLNDPVESWGLVEAGYMIHPDHWDNGYATDAVRELCGYAFEERRYNKVTARAYETNPASRRVLEKVGFTEEGRFRAEAFVDGEFVDIHRYGLLADEWADY